MLILEDVGGKNGMDEYKSGKKTLYTILTPEFPILPVQKNR